MLEVLIIWTVIVAFVFFCGKSLVSIIFNRYRQDKKLCIFSADIFMMVGFVALTVYVQFFSLFYKVGLICFAAMTLMVAGLYVISHLMEFRYNRKSFIAFIFDDFREIFKQIANANKFKILLSAIVIVLASLWTSYSQEYYDTWFYHSQAIRWFEEYGVIKGLGNLHCRFGYNSSFMGLQALFGFRFLRYPSWHVMNGFISAFFCIYAISSNNLIGGHLTDGLRSVKASDLLKLSVFVWIFPNALYMSSCQTDDMAMLTLIYILSKWMEAYEHSSGKMISDDEELSLYCFLSVIAVFSLTVKLSAAACVLLAAYPFIILIQKRRFRELITSLVGGVIVVLPWIIRNVIITGYLVYPFPAVDLFDVEWKIPKAVAEGDKLFISNYAKWNWGPEELDNKARIFVVVGIVCFIMFLINYVRDFKRKENWQVITVETVALVGIIYWAVSAPALRFVQPYICFFILYSIFVYRERIIGKLFYSAVAIQMFLLWGMFIGRVFTNASFGETFVHQKLYSTPVVSEQQWEGMTIYHPDEGYEIIGYDYFPAYNYSDYIYPEKIEDVELIGESLKDGVRWKND